jgi:hypothetical protein
MHGASATAGDMPKKRRHTGKSQEPRLATEPVGDSRSATINGSSGAQPGSGLHRRRKRPGRRRADSTALGYKVHRIGEKRYKVDQFGKY